MKILCAENTKTFGDCSHKNLMDKAGWTDTLNPDVTNGGSAGDAVVYTMKQGCFSYADMLPVKVFILLLYSIEIKSKV